MHVSSLWGEYSEGSFGTEAFAWIDFLSDCGFGLWQVLPFCLPDECNSPYKSFSAFSGNPNFIDLPTLCREGLITEDELIEVTPKSIRLRKKILNTELRMKAMMKARREAGK